jgi:predicted RND superfamily exporter protein
MLIRTLKIIVPLIFGASLLFLYSLKNIRFDYDFEQFFPIESDDSQFYYQYRKSFGSDNEFLLLGIRDSSGLFNRNALLKIDALGNKIRQLKNVNEVISVTTLEQPIISDFGVDKLPLLRLYNDTVFTLDSSKFNEFDFYNASFCSKDRKALCMVIKHKEQLSREAADSLLLQVKQCIERYSFSEMHLSGKINSEHTYIHKTRLELALFMSLSALLVLVFLWISFRNIGAVIVPIAVVLLAILWTMGCMTLMGKAIDIMIIVMPCILFVVGMSDVLHITSQFYEKLSEGFSREDAVNAALKEVGLATFLTCVSTMAAFLTLNTTSIKPIRDFGNYTALGVAIAYFLSITLLPWVLLRSSHLGAFKIHTVNEKWDRGLRRLLIWVWRNPRKIMLGTVAFLFLSVWGILQIEINNSVLDDLEADDPIQKDFLFFDHYFGGVRSFELNVECTQGKLLSYTNLGFIDKLDAFLEDSMGMSSVVSPARLMRSLNVAANGGEASFFKLPADSVDLEELLAKTRSFIKTKQARQIIKKDIRSGRISGRMQEKGSRLIALDNQKITEWIQRNKPDGLSFRITGSSDLIDKSNTYLTQNMIEGLSLDVVVLMLIIGWMFRSSRMMVLSAVPNLIPLLIIGGIMGWCAIDMKVSISIIFSIAFGIAIDDTLHLLARLKLELAKGSRLPLALKTTYVSTGKAMILTALVIATGFATLMASDFKSTFYVGFLISLTLLIALVAELILLPVLLLWFYKRPDKQQKVKH